MMPLISFLSCLLLFLLNGSLSAAGSADFKYCNDTSWVKFNGSCYLFERKYTQRMSYYDAEDYCRSLGAHLVSIHSDEENNFILKTMEKGGFGSRHWIGLNILAGDENPQWSDGTSVNFQKRVPKQYSFNDKCFIMFLSQKGWRPEHCSLHYPPLCKRAEGVWPTAIPPPTTTAPPAGNCPEDWIQFGQKCYKYFGGAEKDRLKYDEARDACWRLGKGYDLVSIHSIREQAFLTENLYDSGVSAWIGMRQITSDEIGHDIVFGWTDNSRTDFTNWARGHPPPGTWKYCTYLDYEGVSKGQWIADYCGIQKRGYICQRPTDPNLPPPPPKPSRCKTGVVGYRTSCYAFFEKTDTQENAEQICKDFGGQLVSVVDGFEQAFLLNFLSERVGKSGRIGIGLRNAKDTQYYRWPDRQPLYYTNWAKGQPRADPKGESCVFMDVYNSFKWNVTNCGNLLPFVCKNTTEVPPPVPQILGKCPSNETWIDIGDQFCYHVANGSNHVLTWDAASRYCISKGMKMVRINSDHQTHSLTAYLWDEAYSIHLGLIRSFDKKSFIWVDGTPLNYTNWEDREPSSWSSDNNCAVFSQSAGKWRPIKCSDYAMTVCSAPKILKRSL